MPAKTTQDLFIQALSDVYSAEKQLTKSLSKMASASSSPDLSAAFTTHLEHTNGQIERIDHVAKSCGIKLKRIKCVAMEGLVEDGQKQIEEIEARPVRDAALIGAAHKVEHYDIAAYGALAALAKQLEQKEAVTLLLKTLQEEKATDAKLSMLVVGKIAEESSAK
jgi:ferritin-like metal-binding protein YciE